MMIKRLFWSLLASVAACGGDASGPALGSAAKIAIVSGSAQSAQAGQALAAPLVVQVTDASSRPVANALVTFAIKSGGGTLSQALDTTDASGYASAGWIVGTTSGPAQIEASAQFVGTPVRFDATITPGPLALIAQTSGAIGATPGGFETADSIAVRVTDNFNNPVVGQAVTFSVLAGGGTVSAATRSTGADGIARTSWTVGKTGAQTLRATAGSLNVDVTATAVSCPEITLAVGEVQSLAPASAACATLNGTAQRYLVTIVNATNSPVSLTGYKARGLTDAPTTSIVSQGPATSIAASAETGESSASLARERVHAEILQRNMELLRPELRSANDVAAQRMPPAVGDLIQMKLPDITVDGCNTFTPVVGRVVYVGAKSVMLEDTTNPLKGQVDTLYKRVGQEFDTVMYPILRANFGDPLVMDAQLNNDGAMYMLFSAKVNVMGNGQIAGFVSTADFLPQCPSSNAAEAFYARSPTALGTGTAEPFLGWEFTRAIASTIIHEAKHLTSFAAKMAQPGFPGNKPQDGWLEESSAELAQELLSRTTFSNVARSNVGYATTIAKEVRPSSGLPFNMINAFRWLHAYVSDPESLSLVGSTAPGDVTFYGGGWGFLRWVIDTYATSEPAFLTAMTRDIANVGVANIENLTGKPFSQLLSEYSLALALDDYPGFTPIDPKYSFPSWNLRSIFAGMSADFPTIYSNPTPLKVRSSGFGKFNVDVGGVRGGGFSVLQLSGTQANRQLLEFKGANGGTFPAELRVNIVRIQ